MTVVFPVAFRRRPIMMTGAGLIGWQRANDDMGGAGAERPGEREALALWQSRIAALRAPACGMMHESIARDAAGSPTRNAHSPSGFARIGLCPEAVRAAHLGCSHTTARYLLREALQALAGGDCEGLLAELSALENAISLLDHRRYDVESRHAVAVAAGAAEDIVGTRRDLDDLVAEHHGYVDRVQALRDEVMARLDAALAR